MRRRVACGLIVSRKGDPPCGLVSLSVFPYREEMEVHFTPEQEAQLAQIATKAGTDPEHLVRDAALRLLEQGICARRPAPELPLWHLGAVGTLHRRDIYNDVR
jgi:hypothetical protein